MEMNLGKHRKISIFAMGLILISMTFDFKFVEADEPIPDPIEVEKLTWITPPQLSGLSFAWVSGAEKQQGLYVLRVRLNKGTKIPAHSHPDQRLSTVLAGTLYVGFGEKFEKEKLSAIEQGNAYIAPAEIPHFIWAKDGDVVYQETGTGPTATEIISQ